MTALLLGATGLIGKETLALLSADPRFDRVLVLARKPGASDARVEWRVTDFDAPDTYARLAGEGIDVVFCCMGTTMKQAGSKEAFRRVDYEYPMRVADALRPRAGQVRFVLVSSVGADSASPAFYLRTKGELERDLAAVGFRSLDVFQPSFLLGAREAGRPLEAVSGAFARPLGVLMMGPLAKYRAIEGRDVAAALVRCVQSAPGAAVTVHLYGDMMGG